MRQGVCYCNKATTARTARANAAASARLREPDAVEAVIPVLVFALVFLCWALLTLLVIAHERDEEQRNARESQSETHTLT